MPIQFSIPTSLAVNGAVTVSGLELAPTGGGNRLRVGSDFVLLGSDSGNLATSSSLVNASGALVARDLAISGALQALITQSDSDVSSVNGQQGALVLTGGSMITITSGAAGQINIACDTSISGALTATGAALFARDAAISGGLEARLIATGNSAVAYAAIGDGSVTTLLVAASGQLLTYTSQTGQQAWSAANNNGINLSGNLTATGVALIARINSVGTTLSGNATQTGAQLISYVNAVSGVLAAGGAGGAAGVSYINGVSGVVTIGGVGGNTTSLSGQSILISGRGTQTIGILDIDWSAASVFKKTLTGNSTFTFSNSSDGQSIVVALTNTGAFTATWPTVAWANGIPPVQTTGRTDMYTFTKITTLFYGTAVQNML